MKTLKILVISQDGLSNRTVEECEQARSVMKIPNILDVQFDYVTVPKVLNSFGSKDKPNLQSFAKTYQPYFKNYHGAFVWCSEKEWKKRKWRSSLYGSSTIYNNTYISMIGRWAEYSRYQQSHRFPKPYNKLPELALGIWHETCHAVCRLFGFGKFALTHTYFYGYDRLYTKAQEKKDKPKRYKKTPNPYGLWSVLPWQLLRHIEIDSWEQYDYLNKKQFTYPEKMKPELLERLNKCFKEYGKKVKVNSDWRAKGSHSSGYDIDVDINGGTAYRILHQLYKKGMGNTFYKLTQALVSGDIIKNDLQLDFAKIALKNGFTRIGFYNGHMHVGTDPNSPQNVVWTGLST